MLPLGAVIIYKWGAVFSAGGGKGENLSAQTSDG